MPLWILNRPTETANPAELRVAEWLTHLTNEWVIRWGFYYHDNAGTNREGDFLILGPHGGLLVLEVKSGSLDFFAPSGRWQTDDADHPLFQLDMEWRAVVESMNANRNGRFPLYVTKALAVPDLDLSSALKHFHGIPRSLLFTRSDLKHFGGAWHSRFDAVGVKKDGRSREIFLEVYAQEIQPKALRHFVSQSDQVLMRQTEGNYETLDQLAGNRHFLVQGGTGSGKTWLAFELARRWAEQGQEVLLLCYNLALTHYLRELVANAARRRIPSRGRVTVLSWEQLAQQLLDRAGLRYELPADNEMLTQFYSVHLPDLMMQIVHEGLCAPAYDALVVDEGQDHDTEVARFPADWEGPGWWGIYWRLLHLGKQAQIAVFHDPAQRPLFRIGGEFSEETLARMLGPNLVRLQLLRTVRYTRPVFEYLKGLRSTATQALVDGLRQRSALPDGPEVEVVESRRNQVVARAEEMVRRWITQGLCGPDDVLVVSQHSRMEKSALGESRHLAGYPLEDFLHRAIGSVGLTSANRAKGLDALAVILVDFPKFEVLSEPPRQVAYFIGASRARQVLGIIHTLDWDSPD